MPAGFAASNVVSATADLDRVGALIDAAVEAGANQVNGPSLGVADQGKLYRQALKAAVADARLSRRGARRRSRSIARQGDLGRRGRRRRPPSPMYEKAAVSDGGTPIEAGTQRDDRDDLGHVRARL